MSTCYPSSIVCMDLMEVNKGEYTCYPVIYMYFAIIIVGVVVLFISILIILIIVPIVATIKMNKKKEGF